MAIRNEVEQIRKDTIIMGDLANRYLKNSFQHFFKEDHQLVDDNIIDEMERRIEIECLNILVKENLYASDLKEVIGMIKMIADIERLGDHAEDIEEIASKLEKYDYEMPDKYRLIISKALKMVDDSMEAFVHRNLDLAHEVIKADEEIDKLYVEIINEEKNPFNDISLLIYNILVIKYVERIADHAVNVSEWVEFIISGSHKGVKIY